ncbi:MAG: hypothetical protein K2Q20_14975 [Phycisphaerales bacterium]|nr:hypothetical protein [Phycisphaerales bacterium]
MHELPNQPTRRPIDLWAVWLPQESGDDGQEGWFLTDFGADDEVDVVWIFPSQEAAEDQLARCRAGEWSDGFYADGCVVRLSPSIVAPLNRLQDVIGGLIPDADEKGGG